MRKSLALGVVATVALAATGVALAGNGGVAPPPPHSPNAARISDAYWLILGVTGGIFVIVQTALLWFIVRYRRRGRPRNAEGPQVIGNTRLELIWTALPALILVGIASFVLYKLPGIKDAPSASAAGAPLNVEVVGHQFYWEFKYPNGAASIDRLVVPVNRVVKLHITSGDVDHSWWIPELHGKFDAIPGRRTYTWFSTDKTGVYRGQCGEFCGLFHAKMSARVAVVSAAAFQTFVTRTAPAVLGASEWRGACAKCHGLAGKGGYGPRIANNPRLNQPASLTDLLEHGQDTSNLPGVMPPVGAGWSRAQVNALIRYVKANVSKGAASGGG